MIKKTKSDSMCFRCHNKRKATIKCDCLECCCETLICDKCFQSARCRRCSMNCRNWLFYFFQEQDANEFEELTVIFEARQKELAKEFEKELQFQQQMQKRYNWNQTPPPPPSRMLKASSKSDLVVGTSLEPKKKMTELKLQADWECEDVLYTLDFKLKSHRRLFFRMRFELEDTLLKRKNILPIGQISETLIEKLNMEYKSIMEQYKQQHQIFKASLTKRPNHITPTERCNYCKIFEKGLLKEDEIQRHDDYHIQQNLYEAIKMQKTDQVYKEAENFYNKNQQKTSLANSVSLATSCINNKLQEQEKRLKSIYDNIRIIKQNEPSKEQTQLSQDFEQVDIDLPQWKRQRFLPQGNENFTSKNINNKLNLVDNIKDSGKCKTCNVELAYGLDENQDWAYDKNSRRVNGLMYCSIGCVVDNLSEIEAKEVKVLPDFDNNNCPTCNKVIGKHIFGLYYNDLLYDCGCGRIINNENCESCVTIRVGGEEHSQVFCNYKCAGFVLQPDKITCCKLI